MLLLEKSNNHYIKVNNLNYKKYSLKIKKYWRVFSFLRSFSIVYTLADTFICFNPNNNLVPVYEISKLNIPIVGIVDTNTAYASHVTFPIFSNDDSLLLNIFYINLFLNSFNIGLLTTKNIFDISLKYKSKVRRIRRLRLVGSNCYKSKRSLYNIRGNLYNTYGSDYTNSSRDYLKLSRKLKNKSFHIRHRVKYQKSKSR